MIALGYFFIAPMAYASVRINEIAWMGTTISSTNEWIELANDGAQAVDLSGWRLDAEDGSPAIALSGVIGANGYYLIERTDDNAVPNITADLVAPFGNGLSNTGETLRLKDHNGTVVDTVVGGTNWANVGGDNTTKATAERTDTGWITASGTPRAVNASSGEVLGASTTKSDTVNTSDVATSSETQSAPSTPTSHSPYAATTYPRKTISVQAGEDQMAFVGVPVTFTGLALGLYDEALPFATYRWNFGDGASTLSATATHVYRFAGEYTATFDVIWGGYHVTDRMRVSVVSPDVIILRVATGTDGFVELANHTTREIDIAGWSLRGDSGASFVFAPDTIVSPGKSVLFANETTGFTDEKNSFTLIRSNATLAHSFVLAPSLLKSDPTKRFLSESVKGVSKVNEGAAKDAPDNNNAPKESAVLWGHDEANSAAVVSAQTNFFGGHMMLATLLFVIVLIVGAGLFLARNKGEAPSPAHEYTIAEGIIEDAAD